MKKPVETLEHALESVEHAIESVEHAVDGMLPAPRNRWRKAVAVLGWALVAAYFLFAASVLALRYWILPNIGQYTQDIAAQVSHSVGERVTIGSIDAGWQGLRPSLDLNDMRIYDRQGQVALTLPSVNATVSWLSLVFADLRFHSLEFAAPSLDIRRDADGKLHVAGLELQPEASDGGFADWLLEQNEIVIRDARVGWQDELRQAPRLDLAAVNFRLSNSGSRHRFALSARPPEELASTLELRGDLSGDSVAQLRQWNGRLYAEFERTDLAVWRRWIDYPLEIRRGSGGLRLWLSFADNKLTEVVADVTLAGLAARLAPTLPLLELDTLQGRIGARNNTRTFEAFGRKIALQSSSGITLPPADFMLSLHPGQPDIAQSGELQVDALHLGPLTWLAEYLPLPQETRQALAEAEPHGSVHDLKLAWTGQLPIPQRYTVRGRFAQLGMKARGRLPGFAGLSGNIDGDERSGTLSLKSEKVALDLPGKLSEPHLALDSLTGQIGWKHQRDGQLELSIANLTASNGDFSGSAYGSWQAVAQGPGNVDVTAHLTRAEARAVPRYLPPFVGEKTLDWLKRALVAGQSDDLRVRLRGDMREFPWDDGKTGQFQVTVKVKDGILDYADNWPRIADIAADLMFEGKRMSIHSPHASILGAKLANVNINVADLMHRDEVLTVEGQAEGATTEFLNFIQASPVAGKIDNFTADARAEGSGRLQLKLDLPLRRLGESKVAGSFQFSNNQLQFDADLPPLTQLNGRFDFTGVGLSAQGISAQLLGGPVAIAAATRSDGVLTLTAQGTLTAAGLHRYADLPLTQRIQGSTPWRGMITVKKRNVDAVLSSELHGLVLDLPAPFNKTAAEAMPLRFERVNLTEAEATRRGLRGGRGGDAIKASLGRFHHLQLLRRRDGDGFVTEQGAIGINDNPALPERGVLLSGSLRNLDVDRWRALLAGKGTGGVNITSASFKVGTLDIGGKRLNEVSLRATRQAAQWQASVSARELAGDLIWRPMGHGVVEARLKHLTFPDNRPGAGTDPAAPSDSLPAIDLVAENFVTRDKKLGRLVLQAENEASDWRINKLALSSPEGTLSAEGVWKNAGAETTSVNVRLDVGDIGKYLERFGYPGMVARGKARMEGKLSWAGSPQSIDYQSLSGTLSLKAERGQFLKVEPGIAKLLGILSMQALPRRLSLDFRDVFSEGFAFDTINCNAAIARGVVSTQDFRMRGPAAAVDLAGDTDLARETQNLKVYVVPSLGTGVASVTGLINPAVGIVAWLATKILKDPIGHIVAYHYAVTGTWSVPNVEKIKTVTPADTQQGPISDTDRAPAQEVAVQ